MRNIITIHFLMLALFIFNEGKSQTKSPNSISAFKIRHSVVFTLRHPKGSVEEKVFLDAAKKLASIKGVHQFECLREVSSKNNYDYGLSMEFDSPETYIAYQKDPLHESFVQNYWVPNVKDFMEIDYEKF